MHRKYRIGLHVLVWTFIFFNSFLPPYLENSYSSYAAKGNADLFLNYFLINLGYFINDIVAFYFTAMVIAPSVLKQRKWVKAILSVLLLFTFVPIYRYFLEYQFFLPHLGFDNYKGKVPEVIWYIKNSVGYTFYRHFVYGFVYYIAAEGIDNVRKQKELEKEKIAAELAFLKSQINPHFLFNTLNDIYALTYQQSRKAPEAVLKLSALLRYMLKESDEKFTNLQKEIDYLKNVIDLHRIGQKGEAYINFEIEGKVDQQQIAPLILINFVENAFKHGVVDQHSNPIQIKLTTDRSHINFSVSNLKNKAIKDKATGIGLANVKRRLALIYPDNHSLVIKDEADIFSVVLKIVRI
ncbi:MAG: hypothetical protein EOP00_29130 [Pedobacter sp.]|nr:MAG: hypothetical protein EOP00_29130 [Pedobacter sp.]